MTGGRLRPVHLILIAGLALAVRVTYVLGAKAGDNDLKDEGDALYYALQAVENAAGRWFQQPSGGPAADHPPMTALVLTPVSWITDGSVLGQRLSMAVIGSAAVVAIALLAAEIAGRQAGIFAGVLASLYAALWVNDGLLMSESLTALVVAAILIVAVRLARRPDWRTAALLGGLCGLAALVRAELGALLVLLVLPVVLLLRGRPGRERAQLAGAAIVAAAIVVAPWVGWNLVRFDSPVLLSTNDGLTLAGANCQITYFTPAIGFWSLQCTEGVPVAGDQSTVNRELRSVGIDYARDHIGRVPKVVVARLGRVWGLYEPRQMVFLNDGEGREAEVSWAAMYMYWALLPLAVAGAVVAHRRRISLLPFAATVVLVCITATFAYGIVRFRVPADVSIVVLAAIACSAVLERR